jgi:hypothetical protein
VDKIISYVMAPEDSFYSGMVMRRVTADLGSGINGILSETTTGMELDEFQEKYPNEVVDGIRGRSIASELSYMSDEQLEAMGLKRVGSTQAVERPGMVEEVLEASFNYPVYEGYGWYLLSNGAKAKGKQDAEERQKLLDEGDPLKFDPRDIEFLDLD